MLRKLRNNNEGVVFVTVLVIVIVSMVLAISVLSLNISQVKSSEEEVKYIQAKALSEGGFARILTEQWEDTPNSTIAYTETIDNTDFVITVNIDNTGSNPNSESNTVPLDVNVDF